jgi:hypothetical protein
MFEIIALLSIWIGFGTVLKRRREMNDVMLEQLEALQLPLEMNEASATLENTVADQV